MKLLILKKAKKEHLNLLYKWHNLKSVLKNSIKGKKFKFSDHKKWFLNQQKYKNIIKIIYLNKIPIGSIRLQKKKNSFYISYMIAPKFRKKGFAYKALIMFLTSIKSSKYKKIIALVKNNNKPSINIFEKLNFKLILKKSGILKFQYIL